MRRGDKTFEWMVARLFVKWWVMRLIRKHQIFIRDVERRCDRSNVNYAKCRLTAARIQYWEEQFDAWGDWNIGGCRNFVFADGLWEAKKKEYKDMGFDLRREFQDSSM